MKPRSIITVVFVSFLFAFMLVPSAQAVRFEGEEFVSGSSGAVRGEIPSALAPMDFNSSTSGSQEDVVPGDVHRKTVGELNVY